MPALRSQATRVGDAAWDTPAGAKDGLRVPARIHATPEPFEQLDEGVFERITNVAMLPGIVGHAPGGEKAISGQEAATRHGGSRR
jgi:hypothetical protein